MPSSPHRRGLASAATLVLAVALATAVAPPGASAAPDTAPDTPPVTAAAPGTAAGAGQLITLVTGDQVRVADAGTRQQAVTVDPAPRAGYEPTFVASTHDGQTYVIPSDAAELVPQVLDRELFNVTKLAEYGYTGGTPVIISGWPGATTARAATGLAATTALPSIDAVAATVTGGRWWRSVRPGTTARSATAGLPGLERVWLDGRVEATLDASVPLVGAPAAWDAGFDGSGLTVAVLDTGVDTDHPDLAGQVAAARNFSRSDTTDDRFGHGTHVAGIVAGTGAASDGTYTGVAPGATLLNGKVLGDDGFGTTSDIIAGMEWAVTNGADVVNMSLGGDPTDGTDPLSQAVNQLTAAHDVLFVIASGNFFPTDGTIGAPGAADAALTVGSVDKSEGLAFDSGRGPRLGDFAIKPELTAPGVDIVSARAGGTELGPIVDEHYTRISGTSMATPHVAGAAALLLQQDPDLGAAALKAALAGAAVPNPDLDVYQQGGGRLDIPTALAAPVRAEPATLSLGHFPFPQDGTDPVSAGVTYTNRTDAPVTLDLSVAVRLHEGGGGDLPPGPGPKSLSAPPVSVSPATLTVPAGGSATATVQLDVRTGQTGVYGGYLQATTAGQPVVRTAVGFHKEPESYQLTVDGVARNGKPATGSSGITIMDVRDMTSYYAEVRFGNGSATVRVPPGTYSVLGAIFTYGDDPRRAQERVFVGDPEIEVTEDTTLLLDAREANPVVIDTPDHPAAQPVHRVIMTHWRGTAEPGGHGLQHLGPVIPEYALATEPVTIGEFEYYTRWRLGEPGSSYMYDVVLPEPGQVPADLHYTIRTDDLATVVNTFHGEPGHQVGEVRHLFRPWSDGSFTVVQDVDVPTVRTEFVVPGSGNRYRQQVAAAGGLFAPLEEAMVTYRAGQQVESSWLKPANRPGFIDGGPLDGDLPATRSGNQLTFIIPEWVDADGHYGPWERSVDTVSSRLYADGTLIAEGDRSSGQFLVDPAPARYRFEVETSRDAPWWTTSTATRTAWTFTSGEVIGSEVLPLLTVDVDLPVDPGNTAPAGPLPVGLQVRHQPGAASVPIESTRVWVSYDDGESWHGAQAGEVRAGQYRAELAAPPEPGGFASLRVEAVDADGNRFAQELTRAWRVGDVACDRVLAGSHQGRLLVRGGVTCLAHGTEVTGPVSVHAGAGLVATGARLVGPLRAVGASRLELRGSTVTGPVSVVRTDGPVTIAGNQLSGPATLTGNRTGATPLLLSGNTIVGPLTCAGNQPPPVDGGVPNTVTGPRTGQCR